MLESIALFAGEIGEGASGSHREVLERISGRIDGVLQIPEIKPAQIALDRFLVALIENTRSFKDRAGLAIETRLQQNLSIQMDPGVLGKVCTGFLKNEIENTPDEGLFRVASRCVSRAIAVNSYRWMLMHVPIQSPSVGMLVTGPSVCRAVVAGSVSCSRSAHCGWTKLIWKRRQDKRYSTRQPPVMIPAIFPDLPYHLQI